MIDPSLIMIVSASFLRFLVDLLVDNAAVPSSLCNWACWSFIGALLSFCKSSPSSFPIRENSSKASKRLEVLHDLRLALHCASFAFPVKVLQSSRRV